MITEIATKTIQSPETTTREALKLCEQLLEHVQDLTKNLAMAKSLNTAYSQMVALQDRKIAMLESQTAVKH